MNEPSQCLKCKASFDGGPIPENIREHYSPPYRWSRLIGIQISSLYDGVSYWRCPDCKYTWKALNFKDIPEWKEDMLNE